jgi:hypothetical protein
MSIQAMSSPSKRLARSPQNLTKNQKKEVSRRSRHFPRSADSLKKDVPQSSGVNGQVKSLAERSFY